MKKELGFSFFILVHILSGCDASEVTKQNLLDEVQSPLVDITIPNEIVQQYGTLNMESKVDGLERIEQADGSITVTMEQQSAEEIAATAVKLFSDYTIAIQENHSSIVDVAFTNHYSEWLFTVTNEDALQEEGFMLAEELLMKNAFAYQLIHEYIPVVKIQYYTKTKTLIDEEIYK